MALSIKKTGQHFVKITKKETTTAPHFVGAIAFTWAGVTYRYSVTINRKPRKVVDYAELRQK